MSAGAVAGQRIDDNMYLASAPARPAPYAAADDLARQVYGVLGIPVDAVDWTTALGTIEAAVSAGAPFLLSTPNLNFLIGSCSDAALRESLLRSNLCLPDGAPIVWLARLLGAPISERISGSDLFEALKKRSGQSRRIKVCLFGGAEGVAERARNLINSGGLGMVCTGAHFPGFASVDAMSADETIARVNASGADFLAISVGAAKGQAWLLRNHHRLTIPVRANLGATINFEAGTVRRAPRALGRAGLEWLWRIKEEPHLWRRYGRDGLRLLSLLVTRVLPLAVSLYWQRQTGETELHISSTHDLPSVVVRLAGSATERNVPQAASLFRDVLALSAPVTLDLSATNSIDARFMGLLLMLRRQLAERGHSLRIVNASRRAKRSLRLNGFDYLLST